MKLDIGRTGAAIILVLFLILGAEDLYIWIVAGEVPAVEFFVGLLFILVVFVFAIRAARRHPPPQQ